LIGAGALFNLVVGHRSSHYFKIRSIFTVLKLVEIKPQSIKMPQFKNTFIAKNILVAFAIIWSSILVNANDYVFENYSSKHGLSHNAVNCILQDNEGFIWIGTSDGLNRFDGYTFKRYYENPQDSLTLPSNLIMDMSISNDGFIWMSTGKGYCVFNPEDETFRQVRMPDMKPARLATDICVDDDGGVWGIENTNMLVKIETKQPYHGKNIKLDSLLNIKEHLFNKRLICADGHIWIYSSHGIVRYDYRKNEAVLVKTNFLTNNPRNIRKGREHELLIVDWNRGVYSINTLNLRIEPLSMIDQDLKINSISDVLADKDEAIWIMGFPGLNRISETNGLEYFSSSDGYNQDYSQMVYFSSMIDSEGRIWLGTQDNGVFLVLKNKSAFNHISVSDNNKMPATKFYVYENEILQCNHFGAFYAHRLQYSINGNKKINNSATVAVSKYNNDFFLFENDKVVKWDIKNNDKEVVYNTYSVQNGFIDSRGIMWMTHWENGMEGYDLETLKKYQIDVDTVNKSFNVVFSFHEDSDGSFWLGTFGAGLQHIENPASDKPVVTKYVQYSGQNSISNDFILSMHDDGNGAIWIGTNGGGLNRFDKRNGTFDNFTTLNGLKSNVIQSITSDPDGNIWFSSNVISQYIPDRNTFVHYGTSNGIYSNYFTNAAANTSDSLLYFGDDQGILVFNPYNINNPEIPLTPIITGIRILGENVEPREKINKHTVYNRSISYADTLILPYYYNSVAFEFASLQYGKSKNIDYQYILEGVQDYWNNASASERVASYTDLQPGSYRFMLKSSINDLQWSNNRTLLMVITPPWWQTWWFRVVFVAFVSITIGYAIASRFKRVAKLNKQLEIKVKERTQKIVQANSQMKESQMVIEMKNEQLSEALDAKNKLIKVLAHDFKNPLFGIVSNTRLIETECLKLNLSKLTSYASAAAKSADSLANQMNSVLEWAMSNELKFNAKPVEINIEVLINDSLMLIRSNAENKNITIEPHFSYQHNVLADPRMISIIFRNILTNAIKYTPEGGTISIVANETDGNMDISFIDTGIGLSSEEIDHLLHEEDVIIRSKPGTDDESGTGIGLHMCRELLAKNGGKLSITSDKGEGAVFNVLLPAGERIATATQTNYKQQNNDPDINEQADSDQYTILLIDDDPQIVSVIAEVLEHKYTIMKAYNGKDGLNLVLKHKPDVIVSDIHMSGISGIELCSQLKNNKLTAHIPMLLISSHTDAEIRDEAFKQGANDYIEKTFNPFQIKNKIESILQYRKSIVSKAKSEVAKELFPDISEGYTSELIDKAIVFVDNNLSEEKLSGAFIANELGISRTQLWRVFKKETGKTITDFIREKRKQKALALLMIGDFRISEIANQTGFIEPRYFTRWFTKEFGMSPTEYVKSMDKEL